MLKRKILKLKAIIEEDKDYKRGLKLISELEKENSKSFTLWFYKGFCHFHLHKYEEALACFNQSLKFNESDYLWFYLGKTFFYLEKFHEARTALKRAYVIKNNPDFLFEVAKIFELEGKLEEGIFAIKEVLSSDPDNFRAWEFFELLSKKTEKEDDFISFKKENMPSYMEKFLSKRKKFFEIKKQNFMPASIVKEMSSFDKVLLGIRNNIYSGENISLELQDLITLFSRFFAYLKLKGINIDLCCYADSSSKEFATLTSEILNVPCVSAEKANNKKKKVLLFCFLKLDDLLFYYKLLEAFKVKIYTFSLTTEWHEKGVAFDHETVPDITGIFGKNNTIASHIDLRNPLIRNTIKVEVRKNWQSEIDFLKRNFH